MCIFWAVVVGQGGSGADMLSLYGAESPDGKGPRWARFLTFLRLLGRICVFLLVLCHTKSPCACFKPLCAVRRGQGPTCYHFLEPSDQKGLPVAYWRCKKKYRRTENYGMPSDMPVGQHASNGGICRHCHKKVGRQSNPLISRACPDRSFAP